MTPIRYYNIFYTIIIMLNRKGRRYSRRVKRNRQKAGQSLAPAPVNMGPKPFQTYGDESGLPPQQAAANALIDASSKQAAMNKALSGGSDTSRATYVVPSFSNSGDGPVNATSNSVGINTTLVGQNAESVYDKFAFIGGRYRTRRIKRKKSIRRRKSTRRSNSRH
jgi:hypothetical protein